MYDEYLEDFAADRKKCVVRSIESNNMDIVKDKMMMATNAFVTGIGVLGVCLYGKKLLYYNIEKKASSNSKPIARFYGLPVLLSCVPLYIGIKGFFNKKEDLNHNLAYRKILIKKLENLNSKDN